MNDIFQLKITLHGSKPPIWRRVLVNKETTFEELHYIIQAAMGWENYHLYEFQVHHLRIGEPSDLDDFYSSEEVTDASLTNLDELLSAEKEKFSYEYDFGDGWEHKIVLEKILSRDSAVAYPVCTAGKMNCPPEDCGGIGGFYHLQSVAADEKHPDYEEMCDWLGEDYDPEHFDLAEKNQALRELFKD